MSHGGLGIEQLADVQPLALGGRGDLFSAIDLKLDRRVAVRVLPPVENPEEHEVFLERARLLASISDHPNLTRVYDIGVSGRARPFVIMELVGGPDLGHRLQANGPMPWPRAVDLVLQVAAGLGSLHGLRWFHRDLRPANVFLAGSQAKLSDVGLLPGVVGPVDDPTVLVHRAPEVAGRPATGDSRSDLYSLTSILYELIDGQPPHWRPDDTVSALEARLVSQTAPPLDPEMVPAQLGVFVAAGLSHDPLDRPQDVPEFIGELEVVRQGRVTGSTPSVLHRGPATSPVYPAWAEAGGELTRPLELVAIAAAPPTIPSHPGPEPAQQWPPPGPDQRSPSTPPPEAAGPAAVAAAAAARIGPANGFGASGLKSPPLVGVAALVAIGLLGLLAVVALSLRGSDRGQTVLPSDSATGQVATIDGQPTDDSSPTTALAPLAMLTESTTTTVSPDPPPSLETTVRRATVPDLVGLDVERAGQILADTGFDVLVVGRVSPGSLPGTVIQQTPTAGSMVTLPISVTLFIPRSATLPFMVGRPADTVCLQLTALGLVCEQSPQFDDLVPAGAVISTEPTEGSAFVEGSTVRLRVSQGPLVEMAVPQVAGLTEAEARAALTDAGFANLTFTATPSDSVPPGQVIGTDPSAGTSLALDQAVTVQMSSGPAPRVVVPTLVGLERAAAEAVLSGAQLAGDFVGVELATGDPDIGRVISTDPDEGAMVMAGSTVTVTIGQEAVGATTSTTTAG